MSASARMPEQRERRRKMNAARWSKPGERARQSAHNKRMWSDPEMRVRMVAGNKAAQNSPEVLKKHVTRTNAPEWKARVSAQLKRRWAVNSEFKATVIAASRAYHNLPETKRKKSERMKALWGDEIWRAKRRTPSGRLLQSATDLIKRVEKLVPHYLPPEMRADVCQDVLISLFDGSSKASDLDGATKAALSRYRKMYPDLNRAPLSIHLKVRGSDALTIGDTLTNEDNWSHR